LYDEKPNRSYPLLAFQSGISCAKQKPNPLLGREKSKQGYYPLKGKEQYAPFLSL